MKSAIVASVLIITAVSAATPLCAETILVDFEDISVPRGGNSIGGDRVSNGIFFDSSTNHTHIINGFNNADNGSTNLAVDDWAGANTLAFSAVEGSIFSLLKLDIGEWSGVANDHALTVEVIGLINGGGSIVSTLSMDGEFDGSGPQDDFQTETFIGWNNLTSVSMQGFGGFRGSAFAIDNVVVATIPEPSAIWLCLFALGFPFLRNAANR